MQTVRRMVNDRQQARWGQWVLPVLIAVLFVLVERQRVSTQIVARYEDFFAFVERATAFDPGNLSAFDWAYGLYPFGLPLLLWAGVQLGFDVLTVGFVLSIFGGAIGLLGAFALVRALSGNYGLAVISEFVLACVGNYLYYGTVESTDMLAAGLQICAMALLASSDKRWTQAGVAGLVVGVSYLIRYTASLIVLLGAAYLLALAWKQRDRAWSIACGAFVLGALIGGSPQLIASAIVKGNPFYTTQGHNLWFTLTGSADYLYDWHAEPMDISILEVFRRFPRQVFEHWWREFSGFWMTSHSNFLEAPFYPVLQAGVLFTLLAHNGLDGRRRIFIALYTIGALGLYSFMRLDKRFLLAVMPVFVFSAVYFVWQLTPPDLRLRRWVIPVRWPVMLLLMAWAALYPWNFRSSNLKDEETIQTSNVLHAAGMQSFQEVFSTDFYLQDVADPWKRRFGISSLTGPRFETYEQLIDFIHRTGYRFFIYEQRSAEQLYRKLASLPFPDARSAGLTPIFVPESKRFIVYRVLSAPAKNYRTLNIRLANSLYLEGYEIYTSQDVPRGSGQRLGVYLYWKADQPSKERLKVFVHVMNEKGELVGQDDGEPQLWLYPTTAWNAGETVCDFHTILLSPSLPAGTYSVRTGLYNESTGQRLPVINPGQQAIVENSIVLENFTLR